MPSTESSHSHPAFFPQPDEEAKVWRYLSLEKFIWLLEYKLLYMPSIESLKDPFEGSLPSAVTEEMEAQLFELAYNWALEPLNGEIREYYQEVSKDLSDKRRWLRATTYVSCWSLREAESEALWKLYCGMDSGVAIRTTYSVLKGILHAPDRNFIGKVSYINYETESFDLDHHLRPFMYKREAFDFEYEVRIVAGYRPQTEETIRLMPKGLKYMEFDPNNLIEEIVVNPYAADWYKEMIKRITLKYSKDLSDRVSWSRMRDEPKF